MPAFINEYQRKHYEACMMAQERSRQHPLSAAQLKEQALRVRAIAEADAPTKKERLREEFVEWAAKGKPIAESLKRNGCRVGAVLKTRQSEE